MKLTLEVDGQTLKEIRDRAQEHGLPIQETLFRAFAAGMAILRLTAPGPAARRPRAPEQEPTGEPKLNDSR